jgi:hypothetical protein
MKSKPRKKYFIDPKVQGILVSRVVTYWFVFVFGMFALLAGFPLVISFLVKSPVAPSAGQLVLQTWRSFWPALFASALMLPILILDIIRVSHRFAGPMVRLRSALRDVAAGKNVEPVVFRYGDFWCEVAEEFNQATARIREMQSASCKEGRCCETTPTKSPGSIAI